MDSSGKESKPELKTEAGASQVLGEDPHLEIESGLNNTHADPESPKPEHTDTDQDGRTEPHQGSPVAVSSEGHGVGSGSSASWRDDSRGEDPSSRYADLNADTKAGGHDEEDKTSTPAPRGKNTPEMGAASNLNNDQTSRSKQTNNASMITSVLSNGEDKSQDQNSVTEQSEDSAASNHCTDGATSSSTGSLGHTEDPTSPPVTSQPHAGSLETHQNSAQPKQDTTRHGKSKGRKSKSKRKKEKAKRTNTAPSDHPNSGPDQDQRGSEKHSADSRQKKKMSEQDENEATTPSQTSEGKGISRSKKSTDAGKTVHQQPNRTNLCTRSSKPDIETGDTKFSSAISSTHQQVSQDTEDPEAHLSYLDQTKQVNESGEMKEVIHAPKTEGRGSHPTETPTGTTSAGQQQSYNSSPHHRQVSKPNSPQSAMPPSPSISSSTQQFSQDSTYPEVCLSSSDQMNKPGDMTGATHSPETKDKASGHMEKLTDAQSSDHQQTDSSSPLRQSPKPDLEAGSMTPSSPTILPERQQSDRGQDSRFSEMDQSNRNQKEDVAKEAQRKAETLTEETKREGNHHLHEVAANISSSFKEELSKLSQQGNTSPAVVSSFQDQSIMAPQNNTEQGLSVEDSGLGDTSVISASRFLMGTLSTTPPSDSTADGDTLVWAEGKEQRKDDDKDGNGSQTEDDETARNGAQTEDDETARNGAQTEDDETARNGAQTEDDETARNGAQTEDDETARNGAQTEDDEMGRNRAQTESDSMSSNGTPTDGDVDAGTGPQSEGDGVAGRRKESTLTGEDQLDSGNGNVRRNVKSGGFSPLPKYQTSTPVPRGKNAPKMGAAGNLNNDQTSRSKRTNNTSHKSTHAGKTAHQQPDRTSLHTQPEGDGVAETRAELTLTGEDQQDSGNGNVRRNMEFGGFSPLPKYQTSTPVPRGKNAPKMGAAGNLSNDQTSRSKRTNNTSHKSTHAGKTAHQQPDRTSLHTQPEGDGVAEMRAELTLTGEDQQDSGNGNVRRNMEFGGFSPLPKYQTSTPVPRGKNAPKMGAAGNLSNDQTSRSKRTNNTSHKSTHAGKTAHQQPDRTSLRTQSSGPDTETGDTTPSSASSCAHQQVSQDTEDPGAHLSNVDQTKQVNESGEMKETTHAPKTEGRGSHLTETPTGTTSKPTDAQSSDHQQTDSSSPHRQSSKPDSETGAMTSSSPTVPPGHQQSDPGQDSSSSETDQLNRNQKEDVAKEAQRKAETLMEETKREGNHQSPEVATSISSKLSQQGNTSPAVVSSFQDQSVAPQNNTEQGLSAVDSGLGDSFVTSNSLFPMETLPTTPPSDSTRKPDSVQHTFDDQEDVIRSLQQEKRKLQEELDNVGRAYSDQEDNIYCLQQENQQLQGELANVNKEYDEQIQHLQQEKQELQEELDNVGRAYSDQEDNIYCLQQENQQLQGELANVNKEYDEQIQHLQQEKQELQETSASLQSQLKEKVAALELQQQESQKLCDNSNRLEAQVREQMSKFQLQKQELLDLREKSAGLEKLSEEQTAAFQHQQQEVNTLRDNSNRFEAQVREQTAKLQLQQHELLDLREKSAGLEKLSEEQTAALQHQQQEVNTLRKKMASYDRICNEQNLTINHLREEKETLHETAAALETQYNQQMGRVQHLEPELQKFRDETSRLQVFETKCQEKDGDIRQLQQRIQQLEDEAETVKSQLVEKERRLHGVIGLIANNTAEKEKAVAENQHHFNRLQKVLGEIKHFQDLADASRKRELLFRTQVVFRTIINRTYRSSMENLEQQNRDMQGELNNYRRKCDAQQLNLTDALNQAMENKTKLVNMEETHTQERRVLRGTISEMNDELERLRREVQHLTEDRDAARVECNRLTDAVEEIEAEKRQWLVEKDEKEDQIQQIEKQRDELITNCKVLERRRQTAQDQSVKFGEETTKLTMVVNQLQTMYAEKERQYQDAMSAHSNLERNLREQLMDKEQQVVPLEIEAKRATLELRNVRTQMENMEREKNNLEITVNALKEELQRSNAAVTEFQRTEDRLRQEMAEQHTQKLRFIKEKQDCQREIRSLLEELNRLRMRRN